MHQCSMAGRGATWMLLLVLHLICRARTEYSKASVDLCSTTSLSLGNAGTSGYIYSLSGDTNNMNGGNDYCQMQVTSTPECRIELTFEVVNLPQCELLPPAPGACIHGCDHLIVTDLSNTRYIWSSDEGDQYITGTRQFTITYCIRKGNDDSHKEFRIHYLTVEKLEVYEGLPTTSQGPQFFTSPGFPGKYKASNDVYKYLIRCQPSDEACYIRLTFDDWSLWLDSRVTIYYNDSSGREGSVSHSGVQARPFIVSHTRTLLVEFNSGGNINYDTYPFFGFKCRIEFMPTMIWEDQPYNDFGEYFHSLYGGHFSYSYQTCWPGRWIDNIYVVTKFQKADHFDAIMLRVDSSVLSLNDSLEIHAGNTSSAPLLWNLTFGFVGVEFISSTGIYIRLKMKCSSAKQFNAIFTSFSNATVWHGRLQCRDSSEMLCFNKRCIAKSLACDGFDHCGDSSDEINCPTPSVQPCLSTKYCHNGLTWYCVNKKCDGVWDCADGSDEKYCYNSTLADETGETPYHWGTILPVVLICLVLSVIACIMVGYYTRRKSQQRRRLRANQLATVSASTMSLDAGGGGFADSRWLFRDAPPSYEEAMGCYNGTVEGQGILNLGYLRSSGGDYLPQPPPYTPSSSEDLQLPVRYIPSAVPELPSSRHPGQAAPMHQGGMPSGTNSSHAAVPGIQNGRSSPESSPSSLAQPGAAAEEVDPSDRSDLVQSGRSGFGQSDSTNTGDPSTQGRRASGAVAVLPDSQFSQAEASMSNKACSPSPNMPCHVVPHSKSSGTAPKSSDFASAGDKMPDAVVNEVLEALENNAQSAAAAAEASSQAQEGAGGLQATENPALQPHCEESLGTVQLGETRASYV